MFHDFVGTQHLSKFEVSLHLELPLGNFVIIAVSFSLLLWRQLLVRFLVMGILNHLRRDWLASILVTAAEDASLAHTETEQ